ncbi:MAG: pyridoxal phosphate-dependent aminotransferase [Clostridia bacterium]|nr:pyridoxal phosphate-dependent aminotransferase [Clostridia bacterium]
MINKDMYTLGSKRSVIRELFEFGKKRIQEVGADKVYDFSLGNPNVPAPKKVNETITKIIREEDSTLIHGYTSAQGDAGTRKAIADSINQRFNAGVTENSIYMTCGAAASLCISLRALNEGADEFVIFAPYFPEYQVFIKSCGGVPVTVPFTEPDFQIDFDAFEKALSPKTKAVIINSPNNPCGVIYSEETIKKLTSLLQKYSLKYGKQIFIISDEPYRELVYDNTEVPYLMNYYDNTIVCYSYSKSLSLPGERIGYIAVSPKAESAGDIYAAVCGAGRALGYVCAPSLFQKVVKECLNEKPDIDAYRQNRDLLYNSLKEMGYNCVHPDGAFYLFVKALENDANKFADRAKEYGLLLVPGDDFAAPGYVRIAYCVSYDMIKRSMPAFKELIDSYNK